MPITHRLAYALAFTLVSASSICPFSSVSATESQPKPLNPLPEIERLRADRQWLAALAQIEAGLAVRPGDEALYRLQVLTLADLGNAYRAWSLYRERPGLFSAEERQRLESNRLARMVVWGGLYPENEAQRLEEIRAARSAMAEYRQSQSDSQRQADLRTRFDELVMLNILERHADTVQNYRQLQAEGVQVPLYALARVGASLLAARHPEEAATVLERVVREMPEDHDSQLQLAYAYSEAERFDDAKRQLQKIKAAEPAFVRVPGAKVSHANWRHYDADTNLIMVGLYGEDTVGAQRDLEALAAIGPNNAGLQTNLGVAYQRRGWTERALERFRMASTLEPTSVGARIGQIGAYLEHDRVDLARPIHDELLARRERDVQVRQMRESWDSRLGWQWQVSTSSHRSRADGGGDSTSPLGSRDGAHRAEIRSPLIHDRWRLTAHAQDAWADYPGERVHDRRQGVGALYAYDRLSLGFGVDRASDRWLDRDDRTGYYLDAGWRFNDAWRGSASWYRQSPDASLQARRTGIDADALSLGLRWTPSDRTAVAASVQQLRYSDDNRRSAFALSLDQRAYTRPHLQLDGLAELSASRASRRDADVPYFNPSRDASLNLGLRLNHVAWRRYSRHLLQRFTAYAGPYWQQGYGSAWIPQLRYEHEWGLGTGRKLTYGLSWSRPVYDGQREERLGFDLNFRWGEQ